MSNSEDKSLRVWDMSKRIGVQVRQLGESAAEVLTGSGDCLLQLAAAVGW